jgi:hypothetical protein
MKSFIISDIDRESQPGIIVCHLVDSDDSSDKRKLQIEKTTALRAKGFEIDEKGNPVGSVGYLLKHDSQDLEMWEAGDVIYEEGFPEVFDNR